MGWQSHSHGVEKRGYEVDRLDEARLDDSARRVGARIGVVDQQRDAYALLVKQVLFPEPMIAEIVAVIAGEDDHGVAESSLALELGQHAADMVVNLLDQPHISGNYRLPHLIARERLGGIHRHERTID